MMEVATPYRATNQRCDVLGSGGIRLSCWASPASGCWLGLFPRLRGPDAFAASRRALFTLPWKCDNSFFSPFYNPSPLGCGLTVFCFSSPRLLRLPVCEPSAKDSPAPSLLGVRALASPVVLSFAGAAAAAAQTIWCLTASQLSTPLWGVAVKLPALAVSLPSSCRKLLLEVAMQELQSPEIAALPPRAFWSYYCFKRWFIISIIVSCFPFINRNVSTFAATSL